MLSFALPLLLAAPNAFLLPQDPAPDKRPLWEQYTQPEPEVGTTSLEAVLEQIHVVREAYSKLDAQMEEAANEAGRRKSVADQLSQCVHQAGIVADELENLLAAIPP